MCIRDRATGAHISYINLSGGVGIPYRPEQTENDIMAIGAVSYTHLTAMSRA